MSTNIPTKVAGENINQDQKTWLEGFFTGFKEKGFTFSDASENSKQTPKQKKLIPEEKIKKNENPFNAFSNLWRSTTATLPFSLPFTNRDKTPSRVV